MQVIVIGQDRGQNYLDLVEFCSVRGIKLVEEKVTDTQQANYEICPRCDGAGQVYMCQEDGDGKPCPRCGGSGKLS